MKKIMLANVMLLMLSAAVANATDSKVTAPEIGTVTMRVRDIGEPASAPLELTVHVACKKAKASAKASKGSLGRMVFMESLCDWRAFEWNEKSTDLLINYSIAEPDKSGESRCTGHFEKRFNVREMCE